MSGVAGARWQRRTAAAAALLARLAGTRWQRRAATAAWWARFAGTRWQGRAATAALLARLPHLLQGGLARIRRRRGADRSLKLTRLSGWSVSVGRLWHAFGGGLWHSLWKRGGLGWRLRVENCVRPRHRGWVNDCWTCRATFREEVRRLEGLIVS